MNRAKLVVSTALAAACAAGLLALSPPADASLTDGPGRVAAALAATALSHDAMVLTAFVVLVCSNHAVCAR